MEKYQSVAYAEACRRWIKVIFVWLGTVQNGKQHIITIFVPRYIHSADKTIRTFIVTTYSNSLLRRIKHNSMIGLHD